MTRPQIYAVLLLSLAVGIGIGAFGGYRYAQNVAGKEVLATLHQDAATTLKSYERIRQLVQSKEDEKLMRYLDGVIHVQSATLTATTAGTSDAGASAHD
jgi:hypothetical protein